MRKFLLVFTILAILLPISVSAKAPTLNDVNQKVCDRFETDVTKLAAIMEELRRRKGITETRVAFGGVDTVIKSADYWITSAAEAIAYQRAKKYSSKNQLKSSLETLKGKVLKAKTEVRKVLQ